MNYIYLIRIYGKDKSLVKLGYTSDIKSRLRQYLSANPLHEVIRIYTVENAFQFEQDFHSKYPASFGNEWYEEELLPTMIKEIEAQVHKIHILQTTPKSTFKDVVEECKQGSFEYLTWAYNKYDFLENAIQCLGFERIRKLQYNSNLIKKTLMQFSDTGNENGVKEILDMNYDIKKGMFISNDILKKMFKEIYTKLNIKKAPKAIDITKYYETKVSHKIIKERNKRGYIIL